MVSKLNLKVRSTAAVLLLAAASLAAFADPAPFDLVGPKLRVTVTRGGNTLPISAVPNLAEGDQLLIKADLPEHQAAHYLLVAAFLRGSTNPPPPDWFFRSETWKDTDGKGLTITVPAGAQQVLVFLAPETGGDFKTLIGAVRGRPGAFVRASQDLNQAALDRSRLDAYIAAVNKLNGSDPEKLKEEVPLLARSLGMKADSACFDKATEQQAPCLMQNEDSLVLSDGHSTSIVEALTNGNPGDLAMQLSLTPQAGFGAYSPYVAAIMDIARIMDSFHTAQYQYIPALARQNGDAMELMLNMPPSFHNPKSVLVAALPAVEAPQPPPLHVVDPKQSYCAEKTPLVLYVNGAPLVFSTGYSHDAVLHVKTKDGKSVDLAVTPDPSQGGFLVQSKDLKAGDLGPTVEGSLQATWGFEKYNGPTFQLKTTAGAHLELDPNDKNALVVGREDTIHLQTQDAGCIDSISVKDSAGKDEKTPWKVTKPNEVEVKLPLDKLAAGELTLEVTQFGGAAPESIALHAFSEAGHLEGFQLHAGDSQGVLKGTRLDEVTSLSLHGVEFLPSKMTTSSGSDELVLTVKDAKASAGLKAGEAKSAEVKLSDGRTLKVDASITSPRPSVALISKNVEAAAAADSSSIQLGNLSDADELPQDAKLTFSVRAQSPATFTRKDELEVAAQDESFSTVLSMADGTLTLADAKVAVASINPAKAFGMSAFGPLKFRIVSDAVKGDWQPLTTLVRLPKLQSLKCPPAADQSCQLTGSDLFLLDSVSNDPQFQSPVAVSDGFAGSVLNVPHPAKGILYVKLRDNPAVVNQVMQSDLRAPGSQSARHNESPAERKPAESAPTPAAVPTQPQATSATPVPAAAGNSQP